MGWTMRDPMYFQGEEMERAVGAGTDAHRVAPYNPFTALQWALDGKTVAGRALRGPEETPSRATALRAYTQGSAWFSHDDDKRGSREVGKFADFAVLTKDYMTIPVDQIDGLEYLLTVVGGRIAYAQGRWPNGKQRRDGRGGWPESPDIYCPRRIDEMKPLRALWFSRACWPPERSLNRVCSIDTMST